METKIIVWSKPACSQCVQTKRFLDGKGIPYKEKDITAPENARQLQIFKGLNIMTAPIVEVWRGDSLADRWSGYDENELQLLVK